MATSRTRARLLPALCVLAAGALAVPSTAGAATASASPSAALAPVTTAGFPHVLNYRGLDRDPAFTCDMTGTQLRAAAIAAGYADTSAVMVDGASCNSNGRRDVAFKQQFPDITVIAYKSIYASQPNKPVLNWPGYYLLMNRATTTTPLGASATTVQVSAPERFAVDDEVVVWNATSSPNTFTGFEYAHVLGISGNTLTLSRNQFLGQSTYHATGSFVATLGDGIQPDTQGYAHNLATTAPVNPANGMRANEYFAKTSVEDFFGRYQGVLDGMEFDVARWFPLASNTNDNRNYDCDNDGQVDYCMANIGGSRTSAAPQTSAYGEGMARLLAFARSGSPSWAGAARNGVGPDKLLMADDGMRDTVSANGSEFESFPSFDNYKNSPGALANLEAQSRSDAGQFAPRFSYTFTKADTAAYHPTTATAPTCDPLTPDLTCDDPDSRNRYGFAAALLYGMAHAYAPEGETQAFSRTYPWDEDTGGTAEDPHYLGNPLGAATRIVNRTGPALLTSDFETGLGGWTATAAGATGTTTTDPTTAAPGNGSTAMRIDVDTTPVPTTPTSYLVGRPAIPVTPEADYTLSFWAKADTTREIAVKGDGKQTFRLDSDWHQYYMPLRPAGSKLNLQFQLGRELGRYWVDGLTVTPGNSGVLTREFDNGLVALNDSATPQQVDVPAGYRRLTGVTTPTVNDGSAVTGGVTVPAKDAVVLVRQ